MGLIIFTQLISNRLGKRLNKNFGIQRLIHRHVHV